MPDRAEAGVDVISWSRRTEPSSWEEGLCEEAEQRRARKPAPRSPGLPRARARRALGLMAL